MEECRGQAAPKLDNPKKAQAIKKRGEEPLRQALYRISGVDLRRNECYIELWKALRR
jgi:hypothetical protein